MRTFHFAVIYNDLRQYQGFLQSLHEAGFTESNTRLTGYDNTNGNRHEPFSCINLAIQATTEPYLVFCHQDIRFDRGEGYPELVRCLKELTQLDTSWVVAGNAGVNFKFQTVIRITDPNQSPNWRGPFPQRVMSLDENLLIFNIRQGPRASTQLAGFHFYGTDVCLNAIKDHKVAYVINFHITHLSGGSFGAEFWRMRSLFELLWSARFSYAFVRTVTGQTLCLSRVRWLRLFGSSKWVSKLFTRLFFYHGLKSEPKNECLN